jgi:DNA polymerase II large subunit
VYKSQTKALDTKEMSVLTQLNAVYMEFYRSNSSELGHYFRSLYNIVKFVKNSEVDNKNLYTNLVRAQLSSYELLLMFYNCLSEMGSEKFKPYTVEFNLLKHLQIKSLLDPNHASLY